MACEWTGICQFRDDHLLPHYTFRGRSYCTFHLPLEAPEKFGNFDPKRWSDLLISAPCFCGVQFPISDITLRAKPLDKEMWFWGCKFGAEFTHLKFSAGKYVFNRCTFNNSTKFENTNSNTIHIVACKAASKFRIEARVAPQINNYNYARDWKIERSEFCDCVDLSEAVFRNSLSLNKTIFRAPVTFEGAQFPQHTTAHNVRFVGSAINKDYEGSYRCARKIFAEHGNRDLEGLFYALEKRSQRKGIARARMTNFANFAYDLISEYGQNYGRAIWVFIFLQILALVTYSLMLNTTDANLIPFTVAQLVKPFELFSLKSAAPDGLYANLFSGSGPSSAILIATAVHSLTSIGTFALALLALRWRFKRE